MKDNNKYQIMYDRLMEYENEQHIRNQKRIKIGLRCIWIVPAIFLFLLFATESSKVIFLVLWIASLFAISVYLICVEYMDYNLQEKMHHISGEKDAKVEGLIDIDGMEERVNAIANSVAEKIETRKEDLKL